MAWTPARIGAAMLTAALAPSVARAAPMTYRYAISSRQFGTIGTYVRWADNIEGLDRARSELRIVVRVLGVPVYREQADENEAWKGGRLISFESRSMVGAKAMLVQGALRNGRLLITTSKGTKTAPPDAVAADPWSTRQLGPATVVTIKTGEIVQVNITGGETETVLVNGVPTLARHYHVGAATQPNWWQIWLDAHDVPVKFRNLEHGRTIDFTLMAAPPPTSARPPASAR